MSKPKLASFSNPPLAEVAFSVQFDPLEKLNIVEIGKLWQIYQNRFPNVQQHLPIKQEIERLGISENIPKLPEMRTLSSLPPPRAWFLDKNGNELIQIQQDRFVRNWRKIKVDDKYPRYEDCIRGAFEKDLKNFCSFLSVNKIGDFLPNQCEVTYVNKIISGEDEGWSQHSEIGRIFKCWNDDYCEASGLEFENINLNARHLLKDQNGEFIGRLHVNIEPLFNKSSDTPIYSMTLIARGRPSGNGIPEIMKFLDFGRENIVRIFENITSKEMHTHWKRN